MHESARSSASGGVRNLLLRRDDGGGVFGWVGGVGGGGVFACAFGSGISGFFGWVGGDGISEFFLCAFYARIRRVSSSTLRAVPRSLPIFSRRCRARRVAAQCK
jgi:hypothetical protein